MSRGTSKPKMVDAVLAGLAARGGEVNEYAIAESIVRLAQPCRVDVGLGLADSGKRAAISRELRVLGLAGNVRATVITAADGRPSSVASALRDLKAATRRRSGADTYRMLALQIDAADADASLAKLMQAIEHEFGSRAASAEVIVGQRLESASLPVVPAVVVVS